jgi:methylisocitrate lyase
MIFAEAIADESELAAFRAGVDVPLLANMTEFGKSPLLDVATLERLGVNVVIYPVTTLRIAMGAVEAGLRTIAAEGTQSSIVPAMQTRARLYELLDYADYTQFDSSVFNFTVGGADR